jgi:hypothetical protein
MVDALVLGTSTARCESSSLSSSTKYYKSSFVSTLDSCYNGGNSSSPFYMPPSKVKDQNLQVTFVVDKEKDFKKYIHLLADPRQIMVRSFLVGTFQGLGFILGSAALLTLLGFFLDKMVGNAPFLSDMIQALDIWVKATIEANS